MNMPSRFAPSFLCLALLASAAPAQPPKDSGAPAAKCTASAGAVFLKAPDATWKPVSAGENLPSGRLVVGLPKAEFIGSSGAVKGALLADIGQHGPFPVLESAVILHDPAGVDLDVGFERGLLVLENLKKDGEAKVRLRIRDETWLLSMRTPGTKVGLEIFGRHAPGIFKLGDAKSDVPTTDLLMLVLDGQVFLDTGTQGTAMQAPPGIARLHWDNVLHDHTFQRLDKLPETLLKWLHDQDGKVFEEARAAAAKLAKGETATGLDGLIGSGSKIDRLVGVTVAGALDDLPRVFSALATSKDPATRDHAILVLRNWLGREPGQGQRLHDTLVASKKLTDVQARNLVHLLVGFSDEERRDPNTYELLLTYLDHKNQAVRALAHWHLVRLAPAGKEIAFDPAAPDDQRRQAVQRWHALIPDGQLPPRPKALAPAKS